MQMEVRKLTVGYGAAWVLDQVSLQIGAGEFVGIVGCTGCGKTTLLKAMAGLLEVQDGEILLDGENIFSRRFDRAVLRRKVGMVFQNPNPFPMSIFDNVAYGPRCSGLKAKDKLKEIVIDSLKKASLYEEVKDRLNDSALGLSGGQQQRLCIARAIAMSPEIILMDEPTSALDPIATLKIEELIDSLKKDFTIIIVTHNMQQATRISDYTAFFLMGEVIEYADTTTLFTNPKEKKTEDYITGRFG